MYYKILIQISIPCHRVARNKLFRGSAGCIRIHHTAGALGVLIDKKCASPIADMRHNMQANCKAGHKEPDRPDEVGRAP